MVLETERLYLRKMNQGDLRRTLQDSAGPRGHVCI